MTESEPAQPDAGAHAAGDALAARLLAAQRLLCALEMDREAQPALGAREIRLKLQLRYAAICTSLKLPAADRARAAERLDRLIADAELARRSESAAHAQLGDSAAQEPRTRDCL